MIEIILASRICQWVTNWPLAIRIFTLTSCWDDLAESLVRTISVLSIAYKTARPNSNIFKLKRQLEYGNGSQAAWHIMLWGGYVSQSRSVASPSISQSVCWSWQQILTRGTHCSILKEWHYASQNMAKLSYNNYKWLKASSPPLLF